MGRSRLPLGHVFGSGGEVFDGGELSGGRDVDLQGVGFERHERRVSTGDQQRSGGCQNRQ